MQLHELGCGVINSEQASELGRQREEVHRGAGEASEMWPEFAPASFRCRQSRGRFCEGWLLHFWVMSEQTVGVIEEQRALNGNKAGLGCLRSVSELPRAER